MSTEEKTFEEIITSTKGAVEGIIKMANYWRSRCLASEKYIHSMETDDFKIWKKMRDNFPVNNEQENDETQPQQSS